MRQIFIRRLGMRDSHSSNFFSEHEILTCPEICDYMGRDGLKIAVFEQFRHALTRHDPKTYLP